MRLALVFVLAAFGCFSAAQGQAILDPTVCFYLHQMCNLATQFVERGFVSTDYNCTLYYVFRGMDAMFTCPEPFVSVVLIDCNNGQGPGGDNSTMTINDYSDATSTNNPSSESSTTSPQNRSKMLRKSKHLKQKSLGKRKPNFLTNYHPSNNRKSKKNISANRQNRERIH